jgi:hypothetical protein
MLLKVRFLNSFIAATSILLASCVYNTTNVKSEPESAHSAQTENNNVLAQFIQPSYQDKPMVRLWFPDAGAGLDPYNTLHKHIDSLAKAGFGGVEVAMLADGADFNNQQAKLVGWGSDAWRDILKTIL